MNFQNKLNNYNMNLLETDKLKNRGWKLEKIMLDGEPMFYFETFAPIGEPRTILSDNTTDGIAKKIKEYLLTINK